MKKTITLRAGEITAWIVLACAIVLFGFSVSFAQEKQKAKEKSEVRIKIEKEENGKKTKIDTTISAADLPALKEYLKDMDIDFDADVFPSGPDKNRKGSSNMRLHLRHPEMSAEERAAFERDMEKLREGLKDLDHEMKDLHIEMFGLNDGDPENFDLHLNIPEMPDDLIPPVHGYYFHHGDKDGKIKRFGYRFHSDEIPDSLNNDDYIILHGEKDEETPVFEKEITTADGGKIFVFKRRLPKAATPEATASMPVTRVKAYPNPGDGKLTISFTAASRGDVLITISDAKGKEVYSKTLNDFSGEYSSNVDLTGKGKGTYFLKITKGEDSITKKLVVE